jgi:hypothetical protein
MPESVPASDAVTEASGRGKSSMTAPDRADAPVAPKPRVRARVRFGEDSVAPSVQVASDEPTPTHDHKHAGKATVRHDRMDLYEF